MPSLLRWGPVLEVSLACQPACKLASLPACQPASLTPEGAFWEKALGEERFGRLRQKLVLVG